MIKYPNRFGEPIDSGIRHIAKLIRKKTGSQLMSLVAAVSMSSLNRFLYWQLDLETKVTSTQAIQYLARIMCTSAIGLKKWAASLQWKQQRFLRKTSKVTSEQKKTWAELLDLRKEEMPEIDSDAVANIAPYICLSGRYESTWTYGGRRKRIIFYWVGQRRWSFHRHNIILDGNQQMK